MIMDQELIAYRYSSSCYCCSAYCSWCRPWRHFTQKSAAIWWVHTLHLPGAYAAASARSSSIVYWYLLTF